MPDKLIIKLNDNLILSIRHFMIKNNMNFKMVAYKDDLYVHSG